MWRRISLRSLRIGMLLVLGFGAPAAPQTGQIYGEITGGVVDAQGSALPGVTVSVSGPTVMGVQTTTTSGHGIYRFPFLPSGTYTLKFELTGFSTLIREGLIVAVRTTVTQDAVLEVAALEESITVTGASPVVDVANVRVGQRLEDGFLEAVPTSRSLVGAVSVLPGVVMALPDAGGLKASSYHSSNIVSLGAAFPRINLMGIEADNPTGTAPFWYIDFNSMGEIAVETAGMGAEVGPAGANINMIPKSGSNDFKGSVYFLGTGKDLAGNNVDDRLRAEGVGTGNLPLRLYDYTVDGGGPIKRDRVWWYSSYHVFDLYNTIIGFPRENRGELTHWTTRVSTQVTRNNHLSAMHALRVNYQPYYDAAFNVPPESTWLQDSPTNVVNLNWTSVLGQQTFLEVSSGLFMAFIHQTNTPEFDALPAPIPPSVDLATSVRFGQHATGERIDHGFRSTTNAALTHYRDGWLGANHQIKTGLTVGPTWGFNTRVMSFGGGDTEFRYRNGAPAEIATYNTPSRPEQRSLAWAGFVQDRISYSRFTLNLGLRYSFQHGWLPEQEGGGGRWIPRTVYPKIDPPFSWKGFAPRAGIVLSLTEDGRNVAKASYGRYFDGIYNGDFDLINPNLSATVSATYRWFGDLNGNDYVDDGEYDSVPLSVFRGRSNSIDPDFKQPKVDEITVAYERELLPNVGFAVSWIQRWFTDNWADVNVGIPLDGYTPATFPDSGPDNILGSGDDGAITLHNVNPEYRGQEAFLRQTVPGTMNYRGLQFSVNKRLANDWQLMGSYTYSRNDGVILGGRSKFMADPNDPNQQLDSHKYGRASIEQPHALKLVLNYRAPWRVNIGANFQVLSGFPRDRTYRRSLTQGTVTVRAEQRGTYRADNMNLLALKVDRPFQLGQRVRLGAFVELHNLLNSNAGVGYGTLTQAYASQAAFEAATRGSTPYFGRPTEILTPRLLKLGVKLEF